MSLLLCLLMQAILGSVCESAPVFAYAGYFVKGV